jgi:hypothetical protein
LNVGSWQLAVGSWQLAVGSWQLAVGSWQLAAKSLNKFKSMSKFLIFRYHPERSRRMTSLYSFAFN